MRLIPAGNASDWTGPTGNNTYLFESRPSVLIDAGVGSPAHVDAVAEALGGRPLEAVLVTHGHADHLGGIAALRVRWPGVRLFKHAPLEEARMAALQDGTVIDAGPTRLQTIHTPGHSPDHCCFFDERRGEVYCGDLVRIGGTIVIPASRGGNLIEYLASLRRVRALAPARLLPGHGPAIEEPTRVIDEYLRHRADRERAVLGALGAGARTPEQIAARVYGRLHPAIAPAAVDVVRAHLIKLAVEGRAAEAEDGWAMPGGQAG